MYKVGHVVSGVLVEEQKIGNKKEYQENYYQPNIWLLLCFTFFPVKIIGHLPFPYRRTVSFSLFNSHFLFDTFYPFLQILLLRIIISWNEIKSPVFIYFEKTWKSHTAYYFCTKLPIIFVGKKKKYNTFANRTF